MAENDKVLVTGARGFIAKQVVASLLERGYRVVGTVRSPAAADETRRAVATVVDPGDRLTFVEANLLGDAGWSEAAEGCRFVMHIASPYPMLMPKDPDDLIRPAREGTLRVLKAASAAGAERVVLTSSVAAVASGRPDKTEFDESDWTNVDAPTTSPYAKSKTLAERAAWDFVAEEGKLELTTINPSVVFGPPLDAAKCTSIELISLFLNRWIPAAIRFGFNVVDVRDVAALHVAAMEKPEAAGERFIAAAEFVWLIDMVRILAEHFPDRARRMPKWELPSGIVRFAALFRPDLKATLGDLGRVWHASGAKAERTFGMQLRGAREAIVAMAEKLIALGAVK
jgi:dihydroflavonol-4-reductase